MIFRVLKSSGMRAHVVQTQSLFHLKTTPLKQSFIYIAYGDNQLTHNLHKYNGDNEVV